jgi:chromosome segregation ATPase
MAIDWLTSLESKVHEAAGRLGELREENAALQRRVEELEARPAAAPVPGKPAGADPARLRQEKTDLERRVRELEEQLAAARAAAADWDGEREEIRRRVEALTRHLEELAAG